MKSYITFTGKRLKRCQWRSSAICTAGLIGRQGILGISKAYVYQYIDHLDAAGLINAVPHEGTGYKTVRKPAKILMANSNLLFAVNRAMLADAERGCVRETFFVNFMGTDILSLCKSIG